MKKKYKKKFIKNGFVRRFKMSLLNFNFIIYIIHKILVFIKNHLNYPKDNIFECFFNKYNRILFFFKNNFLIYYNDEKSKA